VEANEDDIETNHLTKHDWKH